MTAHRDVDAQETREWLEALEAVVEHDGAERADELLGAVYADARRRGLTPAGDLSTPYINSIPPDEQPEMPGDPEVERRLASLIRWNAMVMVLRANRKPKDLGGHIASYASAAVLYETGFNHFWRAPGDEHGGDLVYIQGHSSPGVYARAYLEGRLTDEDVDSFRAEVGDSPGLSSYPHPWLMPAFWQFPTVSMGLTPIMAIYQAHVMRYLTGRGIADTEGRKVWAFLGDGEMDEPESLGAISLAGREQLDNLVFVVNCNLQRLDGPVRGNGKIIQELETIFRGAGWNVLKVIWGSRWDPLLEADEDGRLLHRMEEALDGDYQTYKARDGAYVREHFFGADPELAKRVEHMSDDEIWALNRGGLDPVKVYAAYAAAASHRGQPTVILAKTIKGYGMGAAGEGQMVTHQAKKMAEDALFSFRDRFELDISDEEIRELAFHKPDDDAPEMRYLRERREALGGSLPQRHPTAPKLEVPKLEAFKTQLQGTGDREISSTMAFVRILAAIVRDKQVGSRVVPIVADETRTFGMEGMFRQLGIYSWQGQLYTAQDEDQLMSYKEDQEGQMLQEGISEAGAMSAWLAAATSYSNHGEPLLPVYLFYSMFGFQRVGDLIWAAGDSRARGFLIGGTAGRTTLNGEGLQHQDGHSHLAASAEPNCVAYDPAFGYELAVIVQDGVRRMLTEQQDAFYYLTVYNENYPHPEIPEGAEEGILRGLHRIRDGGDRAAVQLLGSGALLREVVAAADLLAEDFDVAADVYSVTSFSELARDGTAVERRNRLRPGAEPERSWVEEKLDDLPTIVSTDWIRAVPEQIRPFVPGPYTVLGTDGFGRSDSRANLRRFFEIDRHHVVLAALRALGRDDDAERAIADYEIDTDVEAPWQR